LIKQLGSYIIFGSQALLAGSNNILCLNPERKLEQDEFGEMAHKAKPTRKTNTTPGTKSTPKTKANSKTKTTEKTKPTQKGNNEVASYAFTEPVIRILSGAAVKQSGPHQKTRPSNRHDADAKDDLAVFHKLEKKSDGTNIIGTRGLNTWKKSSGRSKSWANCRRLKLARDDLELLIRSKSCSVAFGWPFSTIITPSSFVRSHGMRFNRQSETKQKGLSRVQPLKELEEEYDPQWPLSRGHSFKARAMIQEMVFPVGVRFFRLTINRGILSLAIEAFPGEISLSTSQSKVVGNENHRSATMLEDLVVVHLLQNESHADVYLVRNRNALSKFYHAHAFLDDGLSGNWSTFLRRKMDRLRRSNCFYAETVQLGRKIQSWKPICQLVYRGSLFIPPL
jgi:hypothetical protein